MADRAGLSAPPYHDLTVTEPLSIFGEHGSDGLDEFFRMRVEQ